MEDLFKPLSSLKGKIISGIYLIQIEKHHYVGSSTNIKKRLRTHRKMLRNNNHDNCYMQNSYNKYKKAYFKILEITDRKILNLDLRVKESLWIKKLSADLNIDDPIKGIGGSVMKPVFQYNMKGEFIKEWKSAVDCSIETGIPYAGIHSAANPNTVSKSSKGYLWSYIKFDKIEYTNNTGSNLIRKSVYVYDINGKYIKEYSSLSDFARQLALDINYQYHWTNLRSTIGYALAKPKTRSVLKMYKVSYNKSDTLEESIGS